MKECADCHGPLIKRTKRGRINQCDDCGRTTEAELGIRRHVGIQGGGGLNKSGVPSIIRNATPGQAAMAARINKGGYNANSGLGIGSSTSVPGVDRQVE